MCVCTVYIAGKEREREKGGERGSKHIIKPINQLVNLRDNI